MMKLKEGRQEIRILITGSTGFIGRLLIESIVQKKWPLEGEFELILPVRHLKKAQDMYARRTDCHRIHLEFIETSMENFMPEDVQGSVDYIIHCAAETKSINMLEHPLQVLEGIVKGTQNILEIAKRKKIKGMVYLSSMEVYGQVDKSGPKKKEDELGFVHLDKRRSSYPMGKRMAEHYCHMYHEEYGVPVRIARLSQVFGKGVPREDQRVFAQFARAVIHHEDIVLKTTGRSIGNYCASEDAVEAIWRILFKGQDGQCYNVVNENNTMSIKEMANLVCSKVAKGKISIKYDLEDRKKTGYAEDTGLRLSAERLSALGWYPTKNIEQMYEDLIKEFKDSK